MVSSPISNQSSEVVGVCSRSFSKNRVLRSELLRRYRDVRFNDRGLTLRNDDLIEFLLPCEKAIVGLEHMSDELLSKLPKLTTISKYGVGLDMLDLNAIQKRGIRLGWTGGTNSRAVSELIIAQILTSSPCDGMIKGLFVD